MRSRVQAMWCTLTGHKPVAIKCKKAEASTQRLAPRLGSQLHSQCTTENRDCQEA